jgi:hypothetical protein
MVAALKFFLGQDAAAAGDDEDSDEEDGGEGERGKTVVVAPTKEEVYKATHKVGRYFCLLCYVMLFRYCGVCTLAHIVSNRSATCKVLLVVGCYFCLLLLLLH